MLRPAQHGHEAGRLLEQGPQQRAFLAQAAVGRAHGLALGLQYGVEFAQLGRGQLQLAPLFHARRQFQRRAQHAIDLAIGAMHGRVIQVETDIRALAIAQQRQTAFAVHLGLAAQSRFEDMRVPVPDFGPDGRHRAAQRRRMARPGDLDVVVVVNHHVLRAPHQHHRHRRIEHDVDAGAQMGGPAIERAQAGGGPVALAHQLAHISAAARPGWRAHVTNPACTRTWHWRGMRTVASVPCAAVELISTVPPWALTNMLTVYKPSPRPCPVLRFSPACWNGSNRVGSKAAGMTPRLAMRNSMWSAARPSRCSCTGVPGSPCVMALFNRFEMTCDSKPASHCPCRLPALLTSTSGAWPAVSNSSTMARASAR
ncbi:hypothetical protein D3C81_1326930 [compost metagenome]